MFKATPNPPQSGHTARVEALEEKKLEDAATRALDYYLKPQPSSPPEPDKHQLFIVSPHIDTETPLANASEDLRSEHSRVGKECVRTCRSRLSPYHSKKKSITHIQNR